MPTAGSCSRCRRSSAADNARAASGDGVDAIGGNRVAGKRRPRDAAAGPSRRRRVVDDRHAAADGFGEDALTLQQRRHRGDDRAADRLPLPLIVGKEERAVPPNRPADHAAELMAAKLRLGRIRRREVVPRVQRLVPEELEALPCNALVPDLVVRFTTPPLKRPNSAGGLLLSILNSWIASMFGKNATWPGSGCSTEMPSNRYSLVRGRPPLMRGSDDPGGSATPGASPASVMKLRPFSGSSTTFRWSTPDRGRTSRCEGAARQRSR